MDCPPCGQVFRLLLVSGTLTLCSSSINNVRVKENSIRFNREHLNLILSQVPLTRARLTSGPLFYSQAFRLSNTWLKLIVSRVVNAWPKPCSTPWCLPFFICRLGEELALPGKFHSFTCEVLFKCLAESI